VTAGCLRLALERAELAAHLAQQVLDPQQVGLGGVEPALGLLLALAELEDAGGFLDDAAPILRTGVEDGVDLALADDDVLLAADPGVGQQLLHVEQPARHAVDRVLALVPVRNRMRVSVTSVNSIRQQTRRVVEREADLGPAECRALGGAGEDDVVHLLAAHRLGACAPSTHAIASTTFDLPDPLGPTTTVTPGSRVIVVASAKDLKPLRVRCL
jgi:hypothetical protein